MSFDKPFMIGGGVEHEVEVVRAMAYAATGGAEGVVTGVDLEVLPLGTPGTKIRVMPGGAIMLNNYPGGGGQSYIARLPIQEEVQVTATGSSGARTDLVVARIMDFQFEGQQPPDVNDFNYARIEIIEGVPAGTRSTRELNLSYPAIALARLDLPRSTGTVQASHISDVRATAQPRTDRHLFVTPMEEADGDHTLNSLTPGGQRWPYDPKTNWWVDVPYWAERMRVYATWGSVFLFRKDKRSSGKVWVKFKNLAGVTASTWEIAWQIETPGGTGGARETWVAGGDIVVPPAMRGTRTQVNLVGRLQADVPTGHRPVLNQFSVVACDVEFYEKGTGGPRA